MAMLSLGQEHRRKRANERAKLTASLHSAHTPHERRALMMILQSGPGQSRSLEYDRGHSERALA